MLCGEGRCLEQRFVCDGNNDCGQGEDEVKMILMKIKIKKIPSEMEVAPRYNC